MTQKREYHIHTRQYNEFEQAFVFALTRDTEQHSLQLHEIYIVTNSNGCETKAMIDVDTIFNIMAKKPDGNILDKDLGKMAVILSEVLTDESRLDIQNKVLDTIVDDRETERLIIANEAATSAHPTHLSIEDIVNAKLRTNNG